MASHCCENNAQPISHAPRSLSSSSFLQSPSAVVNFTQFLEHASQIFSAFAWNILPSHPSIAHPFCFISLANSYYLSRCWFWCFFFLSFSFFSSFFLPFFSSLFFLSSFFVFEYPSQTPYTRLGSLAIYFHKPWEFLFFLYHNYLFICLSFVLFCKPQNTGTMSFPLYPA